MCVAMKTLTTTLVLTALAALLAACDRAAPVPPPAASATPQATTSAVASVAAAPVVLKGDTIDTSKGPLTIVPLNHASLFFGFGGKVIAVDPTMEALKHGPLPKADYVFITDIHPDHLDKDALAVVGRSDTIFVGTAAVGLQHALNHVLNNHMRRDFDLFVAEGVPMYNLTRGPSEGKLFHDKGRGAGYVFTFGDKRIYVSGDTECTPEMRALKNIDVAFLCMNLPYTMPPEEAATCASAFKPKIVYPYHYRGQDPKAFADALKGTGIDVRLRDWYAAP